MINTKITPGIWLATLSCMSVNLHRSKLRTMLRASGASTNSLNAGASWDGVR